VPKKSRIEYILLREAVRAAGVTGIEAQPVVEKALKLGQKQLGPGRFDICLSKLNLLLKLLFVVEKLEQLLLHPRWVGE